MNTTLLDPARASLRAPFAPGAPYELDPARCRRLLEVALRRGGDHADLFAEFAVGASMALEEGIVKTASRGVSVGVGVRVRRGYAVGYAYTEDLEWDSLVRCAETAAQIAQGDASGATDITERAHPDRYHVAHPSVLAAGTTKRDLLLAVSKTAHAADDRIRRVEASLAESYREIVVATSDGRYVRDTQPMLRFGVRAIAEHEGRRQAGSSAGGGRIGMEYFEQPGRTPDEHAREAVRAALAMLDAREAPAGELEVVLAPGDSGILLHEAVGHGLEADFNRKGTSNYSGRIGTPVASSLCTVVDRGDLDHGRGSINVDDEGNTGTSATLIEGGTLRGYLHDELSARHYKLTPTGNGRRESFRCAPMPRMTNTLLLAGPHDPAEIVASVRRGIYATRFGGGQVDIASGDFVFSLSEAYLIEDGRITAPLKDVNLIGNGPDALSKVTMLGNDLKVSDGIWTCGKDGQQVPVGVGCPTIKIAAMTVGGTAVQAK